MSRLTKQQRRQRRKRKKAEHAKRRLLKLQKVKQGRQPWVPVKMKMFQLPDFFLPELTKEQRIEAIRSIGSRAKEQFDKKYPLIEKWFWEYDPLYLLSFSACYFVSQKEGIDPEATGNLDFPHHYLEIMQAFALCQERNYSPKPLLENANTLKQEMQEIGNLINLRLIDIPPEINSDEELHAYTLRTEMMMDTTGVRNWAYVHQMNRIVFNLSELIGSNFKAIYQVNSVDLFKLLWKLTEERNILFNEHLSKVRKCIKRHNYKKMVDAYNQAFPENEKIDADQADWIWKAVGENKTNFRGMLVCHADLKLEEVFSFTFGYAKSLLEEGVLDQALEEILDKLSLNFGDLGTFNKEHLILSNPVLHKPFIKVGDKKYYSAIWGIMSHIALGILEDFIWQDGELRSKYTNVKSKYLEDEIERIVIQGFPHGSIYRASLWHDPITGKDYENDLLVIIDSFAIVMEAKSGTVTDPAKRGAPNRLFETLRGLIEEPSEQALRFVNFLKNNQGVHRFQSKYGNTNSFDNTSIKYYIPLGITLSQLGVISGNLKKLIRAKVVNKTLEELAPSISLTDLECVFELLPLEAEKIHYLARRREFEAHVEYQGDELDLLGLYLDNGFNIGDKEYSKDMTINMSLKSKELDPYFDGINEGVSVKRPELAMTRMVERFTFHYILKKGSWLDRNLFCIIKCNERRPREV